MLHIKEIAEAPPISCSAFERYFRGMRIGVLDIETTGLNPAASQLILGGLITVQDDGRLLSEQFFAESLSEEAEVIEEYLSAMQKTDAVVTYNGKHFDIPFIEQRARKCRIDTRGLMPHNLDLYLVLNAHSDLRRLLPNLKQKTVENYFGLWQSRTDEISGAQSVDMYYEYLIERDESLREKILLHNSDDILQLYKLIPILSKANMHSAMYKLGFPCGDLSVIGIESSKGALTVKGVQRRELVDYRSFAGDEPTDVIFNADKGDFQVSVPLLRRSGIALIDMKTFNFDYSALKALPDFEKDYIIVENKGVINHLTVNTFVRLLLHHISANIYLE